MAKAERDKLLRSGEEHLKTWGAAASTDISSLAALMALSGREVAADVAIAARLGAIADNSSAVALLDLERRSPDKSVHKEVRRALYRLEQKGVAVPQAAPSAPSPIVASHSIEGYLSPLDGNGDRLVWLVKTRPSGVAHLYAVINEPLGLREVDLVDATRKMVRAAREALLERNEIAMIEADWRYCDYLIDRAVQAAIEHKQPMQGDYGRLRTVLTASTVQTMQPLIYEHLSAAAIGGDPQLLSESASVLDEKEMRTWFFERPTLAPYLDEIKRVEDSLLVLPEAQQQERIRMVGESAIEEIFGDAQQASWARRLEEMAYIFHASARPEVAKRALAAALALAASKQGGRGIPLCETMVHAGMLFWKRVEEQRQAQEAQGQLVVTPQQALRETERKR